MMPLLLVIVENVSTGFGYDDIGENYDVEDVDYLTIHWQIVQKL